MTRAEGGGRRANLLFWLAIGGGIAVIVFGIIFAGRFNTDITLSPSPLRDKPAPDVVIPALDGDVEYRLSDYAGDIVVLNFWASWCFNCRVEHNALNAAARDYANLDTTFIGVAYQDSRDASRAFLDELGRGDPYLYGFDADSRVAVEFGILGLPETFFIDRDGIVRAKVSGPLSSDLLDRIIQAIALGKPVDAQITTDEVENR